LAIFFSKKREKSLQSQYLQYIIKKRIAIPAQNCEKTNFSQNSCSKALKMIVENLNIGKKNFMHDIQK
jgi:hypothetical protein